jgi:2-polyprenyl-6-methoxyphenol hydroxylase-like FAD-dependent oxidoreductase
MIRTACVIGGGIAGLATALALERRGVDVTVCERAEALRSFGGALFFASNAVRSLRALGLKESLLAQASVVPEMQFRASNGDLLWSMPVGVASALRQTPSLIVPRASVIDTLGAALARPVRFGKVYVRHVERSDSVEVEFEDGSRIRTELLVGADGVHSRVRGVLRPELGVDRTGQVAFVGRSRGENPELTVGTPSATGGNGPRFWIAPLGNDDVWWYALVRGADAVDGVPALLRIFAEFHQPIPRLISTVDPTTLVAVEIFDQKPSFRWSTRRGTLVGDSAHCVRPDTGQGACQALESAIALAAQVAEKENLAAALREYELSRFARTTHVGFLARMISAHSTVETPSLARLRDFGLSAVVPWLSPAELSWVLNGDRN